MSWAVLGLLLRGPGSHLPPAPGYSSAPRDYTVAEGHLPEKARADLAGRLILSLHPDAEPDVEAAWAKEIDRRLHGFDERAINMVPEVGIEPTRGCRPSGS